jgi:hypothetical protein
VCVGSADEILEAPTPATGEPIDSANRTDSSDWRRIESADGTLALELKPRVPAADPCRRF